MALSARMLALIQKIEAADAAHFASLRELAKKQKQAEARATKKAEELERQQRPRREPAHLALHASRIVSGRLFVDQLRLLQEWRAGRRPGTAVLRNPEDHRVPARTSNPPRDSMQEDRGSF